MIEPICIVCGGYAEEPTCKGNALKAQQISSYRLCFRCVTYGYRLVQYSSTCKQRGPVEVYDIRGNKKRAAACRRNGGWLYGA